MNETAGILIFLWVLAIVVAILWICVPFIIMGTNRRLEKLHRDAVDTNKALADIHFVLREIKNSKDK